MKLVAGLYLVDFFFRVDYLGQDLLVVLPPRGPQNKGMRQLVCLDRILQGSTNMVLPDDVFRNVPACIYRRNYKFAQKYFVVFRPAKIMVKFLYLSV